MFTKLLNDEERSKFLELIYKLACCDGEYAEEEQEIVNNYKLELSIEDIPDTDSIEGLTKYFSMKNVKIKRIVLFEVWGMILSDGNVGKNERTAFEGIKKAFALEASTIDEIINVASELQKVYDRIYDIIFE